MRLAMLLALCASTFLVVQEPGPGTYIMSDGQPCPITGAATDQAAKMLNRLKNRFTAPPEGAINTQATLAAMIEPPPDDAVSDEGRFDSDHGAAIAGYVAEVKPGGCEKRAHGKGGESCNCHATTPIDCDTHIALAPSPNAPENQRVIVEVTPRFRKQMRDQGIDWSTPALKSQLEGRWARFTGWMMYDFDHVKEAENSHPGNPKNWRATCWEVHPVSNFEVLAGPPAAPAALTKAHADLRSRQARRAEQVKSNAQLSKRINARNEALATLYGEEGEGEEPEPR